MALPLRNSDLIRPFLKFMEIFYSSDCPDNASLFSEWFSEESVLSEWFYRTNDNSSIRRIQKAFAQTWFALQHTHCFSVVLLFLLGLCGYGKHTPFLEAVSNLYLSAPNIRERYRLQDAIQFVKDRKMVILAKTHADHDLIEGELFSLVCKHLYGRSFDIHHMTESDIESLLSVARGRLIKKENSSAYTTDLHNFSISHSEKPLYMDAKKKTRIPPYYQAPDVYTDYDYDLCIPGLLYPIYHAATKTRNLDLAPLILKKWIFPFFANVPWDQQRLENPILVELWYRYTRLLPKSLPDVPTYAPQISDKFYQEDVFCREATQPCCIDQVIPIEIENKYGEQFCFAEDWAHILHRGYNQFKKHPRYNLSYAVLYVSHLLFYSRKHAKACDFLLHHYRDIDTHILHATKLIVQCTLCTNDLSTAIPLYGLYSNQIEQLRPKAVKYFQTILSYLEDSNSVFLKICHKFHYIPDQLQQFFDFYDSIKEDIPQIRRLLERETLPDYQSFNDFLISWYHYASNALFPHNNYIRNSYYLPDPDRWNEGAIPQRLKPLGNNMESFVKNSCQYYGSATLVNTQKRITLHLQNHIYKLQQQTIQDSLMQIAEIKRQLTDDDISSVSALDEISVNLNNMLLGSSIGRSEVEVRIYTHQTSFVEKYLKQYIGTDLMQKLPLKQSQEVMDYLVTSDQVYQFLSTQNNPNADYSASLISLTKALELVLHYIYDRMKPTIKWVPGMTEDQSKLFFGKNNQLKQHFELGSYINLLKDANFINYDPRKNTLLYSSPRFTVSHFERWGGHSVLDIGLLKQFNDIDIPFNYSTKGNDNRYHSYEATMRFTDDDAVNRMLLAKGLDYIRENYRNKAAHKDAISPIQAQECREIMLSSKHLLWILLAIIKDPN